MNIDHHFEDVPDGTVCVTIVANSTSGPPAAIISQFLEDEDGNWRATGEPIRLAVSQLPELIDMLRSVFATADVDWSQ